MSARRALLVAAGLLTASCAAFWAGAPSKSYYAGDLIRIPHERHARAKVECLACHEEVYDAKVLEGNYRPNEAKCLECHKAEKERGNCAFCHTDAKQAAPYPRREHELSMSHAAHIERTKEDCKACHASLPDPVRAPQLAPTMKKCLGCHQHQQDYDDGKCRTCHKELSRYPLRPVAGFTHQANYVKEHGASARSSVDTCAQCHEQTFCADCHAATVSTRIELKYAERVESDFIHRNDFLSRHSLEARADEASCRRCHGSSFCADCHTAQNITPLSADPRNPHPPGWSLPGANSHGPAARRDITACAACHDQGARSICVTCHKVGAIGGNPHPAAWTSHHSNAEIHANGMCLYCHL